MLTATKNQVWEEFEKHFAKVADGLGVPIDPGIMDTVIALNANYIHTTASCEGHLDHGNGYPWIVVSRKEAENLAQKVAELLYEGKREDAETKRIMQEHRNLLLQAEQELVGLLNAFYQHHPFDYDRHLSIWRFSNGTPCLQSHGAEYQEFRALSERAAKLKEYQNEMQAFATFLKRSFFGQSDIDEAEYAADLLGMRHRTLTSHG